jgi:hypothetical protein
MYLLCNILHPCRDSNPRFLSQCKNVDHCTTSPGQVFNVSSPSDRIRTLESTYTRSTYFIFTFFIPLRQFPGNCSCTERRGDFPPSRVESLTFKCLAFLCVMPCFHFCQLVPFLQDFCHLVEENFLFI